MRRSAMPEKKKFRCNNCGFRFEEEVFTPDEIKELRRSGKRGGTLHCPDCKRTDYRDGWE